jgi:hypothetical protein
MCCALVTGLAITFPSSKRFRIVLGVRISVTSLEIPNLKISFLGTAVVQRSPHMAYDFAPRANIFRRDQYKVQGVDDIQKILRYNNWQHDSYSLNDPGNQISSRFDLEPTVSAMLYAYMGLYPKYLYRSLIVWAVMTLRPCLGGALRT